MDSPSKFTASSTAITNVRVFDGSRLTELRTVFIDKGLIVQHAENAEIVDGAGGVLIPGLIDAHIHLNTKRELQIMAQYGITTGLDMATWPPSKLQALRGQRGVTDIRSPGLPATSPGSLHSIMLPIPRDDLLRSPEDGVKFVGDRMAEGVDYIKIVADIPGPDQATMNAIAAAAHEHDKLVIVHATTCNTFVMAQDAKADVITHVPRDQILDGEVCARMLNENCILVPTLAMMEATTAPLRWSGIFRLLLQPLKLLAIIKAKRKAPPSRGAETYEHARDNVAALHRAGVPILAGTDCHEEPTSPFSVKHGDSLHHELELLVGAGLSTVEALQAATSLPAKYFNLHDRGTIEVGKRADLVLLSEDPINDIQKTRSIVRVWCAGSEVEMS